MFDPIFLLGILEERYAHGQDSASGSISMVKVQRLGPSAHAITNPLDFFKLSSRIANPKPKSRHLETSCYLVKVLFDLGELKRQLVLDGLVPRLDDDCVLVDSIDESEKVPQLTWFGIRGLGSSERCSECFGGKEIEAV